MRLYFFFFPSPLLFSFPSHTYKDDLFYDFHTDGHGLYFLTELMRDQVKNKERNNNVYMKGQRSYNFMLINK